MRVTIYAWLWLFLAAPVTATELTHRFISPDFGGNAGNGVYLMNEAAAQNKFKDVPVVIPQKSALENFKSTIQNVILGQLSQAYAGKLIDPTSKNIILGANLPFDLDGDGTSDFSVVVDPVANANGNVSISISDGITSTVLTVPVTPTTAK